MQVAQDSNRAREKSSQNSAKNQSAPSPVQLKQMEDEFHKLAYKGDQRNTESGFVDRVENIVLKTMIGPEVPIKNLPEIDAKVREKVSVPASYELVTASISGIRGRSEGTHLIYFNKDSGQGLSLSASSELWSMSPKPLSEKTSGVARNMDEKRILGDYGLLRQISQKMLNIDDNTKFEPKKTVSGDITSFSYTEKENPANVQIVDFSKEGIASIRKNNNQNTQNRDVELSDYSSGLRKHTNLDTVADLQQIGAQNKNGEYAVSNERMEIIKKQLSKSFNFPEEYGLQISQLDGESAFFKKEGKQFFGGILTKPGSDTKVSFLYCTTDKTLTLNGNVTIDRAKVPEYLENAFSPN